MKRTELIMGMPITVVIPGRESLDRARGAWFPTLDAAADAVFARFRAVGRFGEASAFGDKTFKVRDGLGDQRPPSLGVLARPQLPRS